MTPTNDLDTTLRLRAGQVRAELCAQDDAWGTSGWTRRRFLAGIGMAGGGHLEALGLHSGALLLYMALLSSVAFAVWSLLLKHNPVGLIAAFNFLIPVFGVSLSAFFGLVLPWGRWPWTIHSAGWGIAVNMAVVLIVSAISQTPEARAHRAVFHDYLHDAAAAAPQVRPLRTVAWTLTLGWLFFAIGPGAVIGNDVFGAPGAGMAGWVLGIPSLWAWQILWWGLGVLLLWLLAYKMELSTPPRMRIEPLPASALPRLAATPVNPAVAQRAFWYVAAITALLAAANWLFG
jgi:SSS family solute:Na+ symporter